MGDEADRIIDDGMAEMAMGEGLIETHYHTVREGDECPDCREGKMVVRTNSKAKKEFLGCSRFPNCYYTRTKYF